MTISLCVKCILKKSEFTYSTCGSLTKSQERIIKFKETRDTKYIYKNELDKARFENGMFYWQFKDLAKEQLHLKFLRGKNFKLEATQNMMDIKLDKLLDKTSASSGIKNKLSNKMKN